MTLPLDALTSRRTSAPPVSLGLFITGTSTGVGKTWAAASLVRELRRSGVDAVALKPFCCGPRDDAECLFLANEKALPIESVNPVWFRAPAAPYVAAMAEGRHVDVDLALSTVRSAMEKHELVIVEGAGGWRVPVRRDYAIADFARDLDLPVVVVACNRLGTINHTLLTVESIRHSHVPFLGTLLNDPAPSVHQEPEEQLAALTNPAILEDLLGSALLDHIPWNGSPVRLAQRLRSPSTLPRAVED